MLEFPIQSLLRKLILSHFGQAKPSQVHLTGFRRPKQIPPAKSYLFGDDSFSSPSVSLFIVWRLQPGWGLIKTVEPFWCHFFLQKLWNHWVSSDHFCLSLFASKGQNRLRLLEVVRHHRALETLPTRQVRLDSQGTDLPSVEASFGFRIFSSFGFRRLGFCGFVAVGYLLFFLLFQSCSFCDWNLDVWNQFCLLIMTWNMLLLLIVRRLFWHSNGPGDICKRSNRCVCDRI